MKISNNGLCLLKKLEGFSKKSYKDVGGIWTIGYGNIRYKNGTSVKENETITEVEASKLLEFYVNKFSLNIINHITSEISQNQFDALLIFAYNIGPTAFKQSTLLKKVNIDPDDILIKDQFLRWNKVNGLPVKGLTNRRLEEIELYYSE